MFAVTGKRSTIVQALEALTGEEAVRIDRVAPGYMIPPADRFVLAAGVLYSKRLSEQTPEEIQTAWWVNFVDVVKILDAIFQTRWNARVCVVSSMSATAGSFDEGYAGAKAAVDMLVRTRRLIGTQQLVAVAPPIIADSGMTERRKDYPAVLNLRPHVYARDVAAAIHGLLWAPKHAAPNNAVLPVVPSAAGGFAEK